MKRPPLPPKKRFFRPLRGKRFIVTAAQNATPVHSAFFEALKTAAKRLKAELIVIPIRYKNPTSLWTDDQEKDEWWVSDVRPYLHNVRKKLGQHLVLAGDVKTVPTASSPLTGFESLTGAESCIIGHPRMQFKTVSVPSGRYPKILTTTGVCTTRNYTDSKAGKIAASHHHFGALIIELKGKKFHLRQLSADADGSFIDVDKLFLPGAVVPAPPARALVMGDTHVRVYDRAVDRATFGPGGMVEVLDPETLVFHDLSDGETHNHHERGNPFILQAKLRANRLDIETELQEVVDFVNERARGRSAVIVDSNHHHFLERWMIETDWRTNPGNAQFYLETALAMLEFARMGPGGAVYKDPFLYWMERLGCKANIRCLQPDESFEVAGIECGMHGHRGPGGAKGTLKNLSRLGVKVIVGHRHAPGWEEGSVQVGTSSLRRLAYQRGPDGNLNTHCVIYANGQRALLTVIDGEWRL